MSNTSRPQSRSTRPLPTDYDKINDSDHSPRRQRRKKRVSWVKVLGFVCVILVSLLIVCVYYLFLKEYRPIGNTEKIVCDKKDCIMSASSMLHSMENSFYPCDDFFLYSCGHSLKYDQPIEDNLIDQIQYKHEIDLKNSIEALSDDKQPKYIRKVYNYYKSCLNEALIERKDIRPLKELIDQLGGWPVVRGSRWPTGPTIGFHWVNTYVMMRKIGIKADSLFQVSIGKDRRNTSRPMAVVDQPDFGLSASKLNDSQEYFDLMVRVAEMMGADKIDAQNDLLQVLVFEKELIQLSLAEDDRRNNTYYNNHYMTVRQMQMFAPDTDWNHLFTEFFGRPVDLNMEVVVLVPTYVRRMSQKIYQTESRVLANYLIWKVIYNHLPLLGIKWREPLERSLRNNGQELPSEDRLRICLKQIHSLMPLPLANIYMKKHFTQRKDIEAISVVNYIKESFMDLIDTNEWMSDEVKTKAKHKTLLMDVRIGFPKDLLDEELMDKWIDNVDIDKDNYFKNTIRLTQFSINQEMQRLFPSDTKISIDAHKMVNPSDIILKYSPEDNALLISAALINGFLDEELPKYLSYSSLGLFVAKEMVKSYDQFGRVYDETGSHGYWWDKLTDRSFDNFVKCYEKQIKDLDDVIGPEDNQRRFQLIEEMIADTTVFRQVILAYRAFSKQKDKDTELGLIGLNLTAEQLFWVKSAKTYYNIQKPIDKSNDLIQFKLNSVLSNIKEFSEAFNCTSVSTMNSPIKC